MSTTKLAKDFVKARKPKNHKTQQRRNTAWALPPCKGRLGMRPRHPANPFDRNSNNWLSASCPDAGPGIALQDRHVHRKCMRPVCLRRPEACRPAPGAPLPPRGRPPRRSGRTPTPGRAGMCSRQATSGSTGILTSHAFHDHNQGPCRQRRPEDAQSRTKHARSPLECRSPHTRCRTRCSRRSSNPSTS